MIIFLLKLMLLPLLAPMSVGIIRKVKAYTQNRQGASIVQPYFDLWKLFHKDEVIAKDASWIFMWSPYIIFTITIILFAGIPVQSMTNTLPGLSDFLVIAYLVALATFFLALAGIDTGSMFGGFGASREMTLSALTEGTFLFSFVPLLLLTHTTNLTMMATAAVGLPLASYFPIAIAFFGFFIALMAETGRIPFDNAATHLELTMIHEAMILEYSGKRLALMEWANANKFLFFIALGVNLFFPWNMTGNDPLVLILSLGIILLKILVLIIVVGILESSVAKFRLFRLPDILLTGLILCIIAIIATVIY